GDRDDIASRIIERLRQDNLAGSIAVAETIDSACLLARQNRGMVNVVNSSAGFSRLSLSELPIEQSTLNVFNDLGLYKVEDVLAIPHEDLVARYGKDFRDIIDVLEQKSVSILVPNI